MALTNVQLWNYLRNKYPNFKSQTAQGTAELFSERGFEQLAQFDSSILNDFFQLSMRVYLQRIDVAEVRDILNDQDFGESYETPYGGYVQRMSINSVKPISPAYKGLKDGDSPDPFVVRKPETNERFFTQNFDYQSLITMPDQSTYKNMFISETGMSDYMAGIMMALQNGYTLQKYVNKLEALNAGINSTRYPLKESQQYELTIGDTPTSDQIIGFVTLVRNIVDAMIFSPATSAFNSYGFETIQVKDRLRMLVKPQLLNGLATISRLNSPEDFGLPLPLVRVQNFGGLTPLFEAGQTYAAGTIRTDASATPTFATFEAATVNAEDVEVEEGTTVTATVEIYTALGEKIATAFVTADTTYYIPVDATIYDDPNDDILAVIADKGYIFENLQNPYQVEPIRNPRGLYTNFWASSPNNGIVVDHLFNCVVIKKAAAVAASLNIEDIAGKLK